MVNFRKASVAILILGVLAALLWVGCEKKADRFECTDPLGCIELTPNDPIKIGVLQALSGEIAILGREQIRGVELALDDRKGKLLDHPVVFQIEDTGCTPEGGANATLKIIADPKQVAILGTTCSNAAATASKAMSEAGLTMVSGNNSAPFLTSIANARGPHWQSGYFRTSFNEERSGKAAAIYAYKQLGIRRAASINDGDIYTKGLTDGFNSAFSALGGDLVLDAVITKGDKEMEPLLTAVLNARAQLIFFPLFQPEGKQVLFQARKMPEFDHIALMGGGALISNSFLKTVGQAGKGMYFVGPSGYKGKAVDLMWEKYENKYKISPSVDYFINAYDAANLLFEGIEKSIVTEAGVKYIGRKALRDALYGIRQFKGVTGDLSCDAFGDCAVPVFRILQLEDIAKGIEGLKKNVKFIYSPNASGGV